MTDSRATERGYLSRFVLPQDDRGDVARELKVVRFTLHFTPEFTHPSAAPALLGLSFTITPLSKRVPAEVIVNALTFRAVRLRVKYRHGLPRLARLRNLAKAQA